MGSSPANNGQQWKTQKNHGSRRVGWPKLRWMDGVVEDLRKLGIRRWWWSPGICCIGRGFKWKPRLIVGWSATDDDYVKFCNQQRRVSFSMRCNTVNLILKIIFLMLVKYKVFFYSPTDAQANCLKNNFKIYIKIDIKTAPTCFCAIAIIRERIIRAC
jgi:hypothetical protein